MSLTLIVNINPYNDAEVQAILFNQNEKKEEFNFILSAYEKAALISLIQKLVTKKKDFSNASIIKIQNSLKSWAKT